MYPIFVPESSLLVALADLDHQIALDAHKARCPHCKGPLDFSTWKRKPRGMPELHDEHCTRWGLCCRNCRKRVLPRSVLFFGRHVYSKPVLLLIVAARQRRLHATSIEALRGMFGVSRLTIGRWLQVFLTRLPASSAWQQIRGCVDPTVRDQDVPALLLDFLLGRDGDHQRVLQRACELIPGL